MMAARTRKKPDAAAFTADAVLLRTTDASGRAYGGFQYPLDAEPGHVMVCPDWNPEPVCGGGFHGLKDGLGSFSYLKGPAEADALWWVWGILAAEAVEIDGDKHKVPRMQLIYKGSFGGAMARVSLPLAAAITAKVAAITAAAKPEGEHATGWGGASSATGTRGASSATGTRGASSATGEGGASSATGTRGASSATGEGGASSATGWGGGALSLGAYSTASAEGAGAIAVAAGYRSRGMIGPDAVLVLIERDNSGKILSKLIASAGEHGIEPGKWYELRGGVPTEVSA